MSSLPSWLSQRVLQFLNAAEDAAAISSSPLLQDADGQGYAIGHTVAQRIIETRQGLRFRRFRSLDEVRAVPGLGADKLNDLTTSLGIPADRFFLERLFAGLLLDNWKVRPLSKEFTDTNAFSQQVATTAGIKETAAQLLTGDYSTLGEEVQRYRHLAIRGAFTEHYSSAHLAAYQLAYWFYLFDYDNWFSFERMREVCEQYLGYHSQEQDRLSLWLLKGFNQLAEEEVGYANILPVVVNHGERKVTVWQAQLFD